MRTNSIISFLLSLLGLAQASYVFTAYSQINNGGTSKSIFPRNTPSSGRTNLGFTAASYSFNSNPGDGCCVVTCATRRETGYFCSTRSNRNVASGNRFNAVVVSCGPARPQCSWG
ncbi:hypothetical protein Slin15195_G075960 [Septoria linicola]|uniref:Uncharacterized protein n=1 Tax=Septoria linicola TaxID=215465 RepID=A0A9Q9ARA1_9PEZI|nr:hypothetical protein Slin15195_G075960 [Septoria linicola]